MKIGSHIAKKKYNIGLVECRSSTMQAVICFLSLTYPPTSFYFHDLEKRRIIAFLRLAQRKQICGVRRVGSK